MAIDVTTAARPYAKAAFEYAVEHQALGQWSQILQVLAQISADSRVTPLLTDPRMTAEQRYELFSNVANKWLDDHSRNFINLLTHNRRLNVLPEILALYEQYRRDYEQRVIVDVTSFLPLSSEQHQRLATVLAQRLNRLVTLNCRIDKNLLGGLIVRAGDLVIDGSILGQIDKMRRYLAA